MKTAFAKLETMLAGLSAQGRRISFFFRDDDVDVDEPSLRRLLEVFSSRGLPLALGVIPALLTDEAASWLKEERRAQGGRIELVQHGWQHINHETEGRKCEFGPSRDYAAQHADIAQGLARMRAAFGTDFFAAFIPPWNRCTDDTFRALDDLKFQVLSKDGQRLTTGYGFREISTTIDLCRWRGGAALKPADEIEAELIAQATEFNTIGVLLHHKVMRDDAFGLLSALLDVLQGAPSARFHTLQELAGPSS